MIFQILKKYISKKKKKIEPSFGFEQTLVRNRSFGFTM